MIDFRQTLSHRIFPPALFLIAMNDPLASPMQPSLWIGDGYPPCRTTLHLCFEVKDRISRTSPVFPGKPPRMPRPNRKRRTPPQDTALEVVFLGCAYKLARMPFPDSSKIFREVNASNAPMSDSAANWAEPSSPNLRVIWSAVTPETVTELAPSV